MSSSVTSGPSKRAILSLYHQLMRQGSMFSEFNYKSYATRRVRDAFRENQNVTDPKILTTLYNEGLENLAMLERQTAIDSMYKGNKLVIEK
eukprot:CFRG5461T1